MMVESTINMLEQQATLVDSCGEVEVDVDNEITSTAAEIIAKTTFSINYENGQKVCDKLRIMKVNLFKSIHYLGVPYGGLIIPKEILKIKKLRKEIKDHFVSIIEA